MSELKHYNVSGAIEQHIKARPSGEPAFWGTVIGWDGGDLIIVPDGGGLVKRARLSACEFGKSPNFDDDDDERKPDDDDGNGEREPTAPADAPPEK